MIHLFRILPRLVCFLLVRFKISLLRTIYNTFIPSLHLCIFSLSDIAVMLGHCLQKRSCSRSGLGLVYWRPPFLSLVCHCEKAEK
ncbi:hypothetical protein HD806DRAFT_479251 [Xylariaceae sp. AK1471]|nr:hypothetical protein HD806DRAFT_479251 [Xylariaceae sp. AK1471]